MKQFLINILFSVCPFVVLGQQTVLLSDSLYERVIEEVDNVGVEMFNKGLDTTIFNFIPVVMADLSFLKSGSFNDSFLSNDKITISEILLMSKKSQKVVGSYMRCVDGFGTFFYISHKYGISTVPCRKNKRFPYLSEKNYDELNRIKKQKDIIYISSIPNLNKKYVVTNSGEITEIWF